jgi:NADP-dependent 3-hydroxy acid dehydrogenase YdfG
MTTSNRTALIIGAAGGLGQAITRALADMDFRLCLVGRDAGKLEALRHELGAAGNDACVLPCDVTERNKAREMVAAALAHLGSIDVLVCASGLNIRQRSLRSLDPADWDRVIGANLTAAFNVIYFVLPSMREKGSGLIIQISSLAGIRANTLTGSAYSASKFAQSALGICIGREERGRGIRSTVLYSGEVNTPLLDVRADRPGAISDDRKQSILQPKDIADAVRFLVSLPPRAHVPELVIKPSIDDFS